MLVNYQPTLLRRANRESELAIALPLRPASRVSTVPGIVTAPSRKQSSRLARESEWLLGP